MTTGDGGMILTNDQETYIRLKLFSDKGWDYQYMGDRGPRLPRPQLPNDRDARSCWFGAT